MQLKRKHLLFLHSILVTAEQGGDAHSIATNMSLLAQLVFDWLDEVLVKPQLGLQDLQAENRRF